MPVKHFGAKFETGSPGFLRPRLRNPRKCSRKKDGKFPRAGGVFQIMKQIHGKPANPSGEIVRRSAATLSLIQGKSLNHKLPLSFILPAGRQHDVRPLGNLVPQHGNRHPVNSSDR